MSYSYQIWWEEHVVKGNALLGSKDHVEISQGQPEVILLKIALWVQNVVGRTPGAEET